MHDLCRAELSPSERARQTVRRKAIYEEKNKETKHGGNSGGPSGQFVHTATDSFAQDTAKATGVAGATARWNAMDNLSTASFSADTSKATGKDERTVRRDAERGHSSGFIPEKEGPTPSTEQATSDRIEC